jgi:SpoVK/Ycf46/Vps4 family AAA+-type ATPase
MHAGAGLTSCVLFFQFIPFSSLWDGLTSSSDRIMVMGATNRPNDIDAAILRRMPKRYAVGLPNAVQRRKILEIMLADVRLDKAFSLDHLVANSDGLSGSDLKEACRGAAMQPVREFMRSAEGRKTILSAANAKKESNGSAAADSFTKSGDAPFSAAPGIVTRPIRNDDFFVVDGLSSQDRGAAKGPVAQARFTPVS